MNTKYKNAFVTKEYLEWLKHACFRSQKTIDIAARSIKNYIQFTGGKDLAEFSKETAIAYKAYLKDRVAKKTCSISTAYTYCYNLANFLKWLSNIAGYKSRIIPVDIKYLSLPKTDLLNVSQAVGYEYPDFDYIRTLVNSIEYKCEIDLKDSAIICMLALSGIRVGAIISLPLKCFDEKTLTIYQIPSLGVNTKYSKKIYSMLFPIDKNMVQNVIEWKTHLKEKGFLDNDPLFPANRVNYSDDNSGFKQAVEVERLFLKTSTPINKMLKSRTQKAGLTYYTAHKFRHALVHEVEKYLVTPQQYKAFSQSLGHSRVVTTFQTYGVLSPQQQQDTLQKIDFSNSALEMEENLERILNQIRRGRS